MRSFIRTKRACGFLSLGLVLWPASLTSQAVATRKMLSLLSKQGFTGVMRGDVTLKFLGNIHCGNRVLHAMYYVWTEDHSRGLAIHQSHRLIFLQEQSYLGSYSVEDPPQKLSKTSISFGYPRETGNVIACVNDGLPRTVLLNGQIVSLEK